MSVTPKAISMGQLYTDTGHFFAILLQAELRSIVNAAITDGQANIELAIYLFKGKARVPS